MFHLRSTIPLKNHSFSIFNLRSPWELSSSQSFTITLFAHSPHNTERHITNITNLFILPNNFRNEKTEYRKSAENSQNGNRIAGEEELPEAHLGSPHQTSHSLCFHCSCMHELRERYKYLDTRKGIIIQEGWKIKIGGIYRCKLCRVCHVGKLPRDIACSWWKLLVWRSKKQNIIARSIVKVEFQAMTHEMCELLWPRNIVRVYDSLLW